jgi:hypothetical protein
MFSHYPKLPLLQFGYKAWSSWLLILRTVNFPLIHKYRRDGVSFFFFFLTKPGRDGLFWQEPRGFTLHAFHQSPNKVSN